LVERQDVAAVEQRVVVVDGHDLDLLGARPGELHPDALTDLPPPVLRDAVGDHHRSGDEFGELASPDVDVHHRTERVGIDGVVMLRVSVELELSGEAQRRDDLHLLLAGHP
jgi:hypothetical protein